MGQVKFQMRGLAVIWKVNESWKNRGFFVLRRLAATFRHPAMTSKQTSPSDQGKFRITAHNTEKA